MQQQGMLLSLIAASSSLQCGLKAYLQINVCSCMREPALTFAHDVNMIPAVDFLCVHAAVAACPPGP